MSKVSELQETRKHGLGILYDYDRLLDRLYSKLPPKRSMRAYDLPVLQIEYVDTHTLVRNFAEACDRLRREPRIVMRFILRELAMPGAVDERGQLVIYRKVAPHTLQQLFTRFIESYVKCPTCGSYDTELHRRKGKIWIIKCLACGAETFARPI